MPHDEELKEIAFQVLISRMRRDRHCASALKARAIKRLVKTATSIFSQEPVHLELSGRYVVVGDIHGNIDDLIRIFMENGYPPKTSYLFLGDYVDRGENSIEVLLLLYVLKVKYPQNLYLLRGNHETFQISSSYGFKDECLQFLSKSRYCSFVESFAHLPITATLNGNIFCVHGGISPSMKMYDICTVEKPLKDVTYSSASDLLWSDPNPKIDEFRTSKRGTGYYFGQDPLIRFLEENNLSLMIRGHEFCENGFNWSFGEDGNCLTIFSSCDYNGRGNHSSVAIVDVDKKVEILTYRPYTIEMLAMRRNIYPDFIFEVKKLVLKEPVFENPCEDLFALQHDLGELIC